MINNQSITKYINTYVNNYKPEDMNAGSVDDRTPDVSTCHTHCRHHADNVGLQLLSHNIIQTTDLLSVSNCHSHYQRSPATLWL